MLSKTTRSPVATDDGFAKAWAQFPNSRPLLDDHVKPHRAHIRNITSPNENDGSLSIRFHSSVAWSQIVMCVAQMRADECWKVDANKKEVTLWWD